MNELVVISGKGGTGKTSVTASLASLAGRAVLADCDVDAANLPLVLQPKVERRETFSGGERAVVYDPVCSSCGSCQRFCRFDAVRCIPRPQRSDRFEIDPIACEGCGVCSLVCPTDAIITGPAISGEWFVSETPYGPLIHARLGPGEGNSGKLVTIIRNEATAIAKDQDLDLVLIDGSPGIGCPVIASLAGTSCALTVTEPTQSGLHDLQRVVGLARHFGIPTLVCINKWDLNPDIASEVEQWAAAEGLSLVGRIRYDQAVTQAQVAQKTLVDYTDDGAAEDLRDLWATIREHLDRAATHNRHTAPQGD